jgi:hypothetical protein
MMEDRWEMRKMMEIRKNEGKETGGVYLSCKQQ